MSSTRRRRRVKESCDNEGVISQLKADLDALRLARVGELPSKNNDDDKLPTRTSSGVGGNLGVGGFNPYGYYGNPFLMSGPLSWAFSLNYFIFSVNQFIEAVGMNSVALLQVYSQVIYLWKVYSNLFMKSNFRKWIQQKSKESKLLRFLFIVGAIAISAQLTKVVRYLLSNMSGTGNLGIKLSSGNGIQGNIPNSTSQ